MIDKLPVTRTWTVNGLHLETLCWGSEGLPPLLALHGWLDNAASFNLLAPLLSKHYIVAPDLTGHGRSSNRSADATYQIWDDLPELMGILTQLGWDQFDLLGHSRGGIISTLLASVIPERVKHLVLLDAVTPQAIPESEFPQQLGRFLKEKPGLLTRQPRLYPTMDEAVAARIKNGLPASAAKILASRGVSAKKDGFVWNSDARLYGASAVKMTQGQNRAVLENLIMPTLLLQADNGLAQAPAIRSDAEKYIAGLCAETVRGGHHFHMEDEVAAVAQRIAKFLSM